MGISIRWWLLLRTQTIHIPFFNAIKLTFLGLFYNNIMPGSVGGDIIKAWYASKHTTQKRVETAFSVLIDRIIGLIGMLAMAIVAFLAHRQRWNIDLEAKTSFLSGSSHILFLIFGIILCISIILISFTPFRRRATQGLANLYNRLKNIMKRIQTAFLLFIKHPIHLLSGLLITIAFQSLTILGFWILGKHLDMEADLATFFTCFPFSWVFSALPISIAGLGITEGLLSELCCRLGHVHHDSALILALSQRLIWILASIPGAWFFLRGEHLPRTESDS